MASDSFKNLKKRLKDNYEIYDQRHAFTILENDFPSQFKDLMHLINKFKIKKEWIIKGGGGKTEIAKNIESHFNKRGWREKSFTVKNLINEVETNDINNNIPEVSSQTLEELSVSSVGVFRENFLFPDFLEI